MKEPPRYYSGLAPFRELFEQSVPILTYHHIGPRPSGARIKGLYVSATLFEKQMAELDDAGFSTKNYDEVTGHGTLKKLNEPNKELILRAGEDFAQLSPGVADSSGTGAASAKFFFLTFDDGFRDVLNHAVPVMRRRRFTGIQFLVADLLGKASEWQTPSGEIAGATMDMAEVREWLAAGNQIGSHTLTHPRLSQIPIERAKEETTASKKKLEDLFGLPIHHFCYPYGDLNEKVRELVRDAGYRTACTTQFGVNSAQAEPFLLKRVTARYASRKWSNLWGLLP